MRERVTAIIGDSLRDLKAGSPEAAKVKAALIEVGVWSQYLEVGIGPDAEVFSKAQVLASVGWGASVGLHPISKWNNPEPEIVLAVDSQGKVKGATLGNDVNLRDVEGPFGTAARQGQGQQRLIRHRPVHPAVRRYLFDR
jgi:fumarylacetoacetate (FAA) hydrolase family protein